MRFAPLTFIKPDELAKLHEKISFLEAQVNVATDFIKEIEKGNWEATYELVHNQVGSETNALADSLLSLRTQLQTYSMQEKERNWVTEGLAKFIDILRSKNDDIHELTDNIIRNLVKYMGANQGALYLLNDDNRQDVYIEMAACYAYDRKKFMHQRIELGEGLAGQVVLEKEYIYMTEVPNNYVRITSGLGDAAPSNLLIMPLKIEEKVFGVVEIASFTKIHKYQIEFVERLGESIASTLSTVKTNQRTQLLLHETQVQTEQMRSQEEEMRQNMEELSATQEEMQRVLKEVQDKEKYLNDLLSVTNDSIFTVDRNYKIISYNQAFGNTLKSFGVTEAKGIDMLSFYTDPKEIELQKSYYDRAFNGESFESTSEYEHNGKTNYYLTSFAPLRDESGWVTAVASFSKDTTAIVMAQKETERLLQESKQQTEEMRAQEEEIRQNMEELSATQEEMQRIFKEIQDKEKYVNDLLNVSKDSIFTVGNDYKVIHYNQAFEVALQAIGIEKVKGFDMVSIYTDPAEKAKQESYYNRAFSGESFENTSEFEHEGVKSYYTTSFAPLRNEQGEVVAVASFAKDVTAVMLAQMETERMLKEVQEKERYLDELINVPKDSIFTVDNEYKILSYNKAFSAALETMGLKELKGFNLMDLYPDAKEKAKQKSYYDRAFAGENFENTIEYDTEGVKSYYSINYAPLHDSEGKIFAVASFAKDTTAIVSAQKQAEQALFESKQQAEELRAQEEELRQNMEELSATQEEMQRILKEVQDKENYLNELINVPKDSIFTVDKNYKIISANKAMTSGIEAMLGTTDLKGFDALSFYPDPKEREKQKGLYDRAFAGDNFESTLEYEQVGVVSYYTINYAPLRDASGEIVAVASFAKDTTAMMSVQKQMQEKENYLNELINVSQDSIFTVDKNFRIVSFNNAIAKAMEASGVKMEKGMDLLAGLNEEERNREIKNYKRAFKGESFEAINELTVPGGQKIVFAINYAPLHDKEGKISTVAVFSKDITAIYKK